MQKIVTHLWFDSQAEEAAKFYVSAFKNSRIKSLSRYPAAAVAVTGKPEGSVMTVTFELDGQEFIALNGGPHFKFTEAVSLLVQCESEKELDELWDKLLEGGEVQQCGWLKDKYGLSWQISHVDLEKIVNDPDPVKVGRMMQAMFQMKKLDVPALKRAYAQG
jgi:predicted 3-demethylubiquinone-9 3-methyltransferase (glyoxalase superfamily)